MVKRKIKNKSRLRWLKIGAAISLGITLVGFLASILGIIDFISTDDLSNDPITFPATENNSSDTLGIAPEGANNLNDTATLNSNIELHDNGKVGTIIIGDSNNIDIKQDF